MEQRYSIGYFLLPQPHLYQFLGDEDEHLGTGPGFSSDEELWEDWRPAADGEGS